MMAAHDPIPTVTPAHAIPDCFRAISARLIGIGTPPRRWLMARRREMRRDLAWLSSAPEDDSWAGGAR